MFCARTSSLDKKLKGPHFWAQEPHSLVGRTQLGQGNVLGSVMAPDRRAQGPERLERKSFLGAGESMHRSEAAHT